jgi:NAD(P)-dependent dehydrogenase (short-subunit alcohol dehydrogenase family)
MMDAATHTVALVTGSGSGIGRAVALAFAAHGSRVVVAGRRRDPLEETVAMIAERGGSAHAVEADVADAGAVAALVQKAVDAYGRLDYACNSAGIEGRQALLADLEEDDFDAVMGTNVRGIWLCMKYEIRQMLAQGRGAIVNISSVNSTHKGPTIPFYCASKAAVENLTKTAALGYAHAGIRINAIAPGAFMTPMLARAMEVQGGSVATETERYARMIPTGRLGDLSEIAEAVVWLCSDAARYITGTVLPVDGGWSAR